MKLSSAYVVWLTGLSGAGKTTLCLSVEQELQRRDHEVQILDGDEVRKELCADLSFSTEDRFENIRRLTYVANLLSAHSVIVLVAAITPLQAMRDYVRETVPNLLEVFVDAPLSVCEKRDPKGLYSKARAGTIHSFTGVTAPFEKPCRSDVTCHTHIESISESAQKVLTRLLQESNGKIRTNIDPHERIRTEWPYHPENLAIR